MNDFGITKRVIPCPNCRQPFTAELYQIVDVGREPRLKNLLVNGRLNLIRCPHCGFQTQAGVPLLYHDPAKELLIAFVPMELGMSKEQQEKAVGELLKRLTDSLPPEMRKGYLFQPRTALTMQGLVEQVLAADGITKEMLKAQEARINLIDELMRAEPERLPELIARHDSELDEDFFKLLSASVMATEQEGHREMAKALYELYDKLMELSTYGRQLKEKIARHERAFQEAFEDLRAAGEHITREQIADIAAKKADDDAYLEALVALIRPAMDYIFFQKLTERMEAAQGEEREKLRTLRDKLVKLTEEADARAEAEVKSVLGALQEIVNADDPDEAIRRHQHLIGDAMLSVLASNIQRAEQAGDKTSAARFREVFDKLIGFLRSQAPPDLRLIYEILEAPSDEAAEELLEKRIGEVDAGQLLASLDRAIADLRAEGRDSNAVKRLERLRTRIAGAAQG